MGLWMVVCALLVGCTSDFAISDMSTPDMSTPDLGGSNFHFAGLDLANRSCRVELTGDVTASAACTATVSSCEEYSWCVTFSQVDGGLDGPSSLRIVARYGQSRPGHYTKGALDGLNFSVSVDANGRFRCETFEGHPLACSIFDLKLFTTNPAHGTLDAVLTEDIAGTAGTRKVTVHAEM